ncbi:hypothetical protein UACE39S_05422 [Ureibacillus acetophenoni]
MKFIENENFIKGLEVRKAVLGPNHVERSLAFADEFNSAMQQLTTEYCWGWLWNREGLERKQRSLINIAILTALSKPHELKLHVHGALRNGCTQEEIREVILQCAIYCGVPAAIDSFRTAKEAIDTFEE